MSLTAESRPECPFCGAPWSDAMLAAFDASTLPSSCACCNDVTGHHHEADHAPIAVPTEDICCATCNRPLFMAPKLSGAA